MKILIMILSLVISAPVVFAADSGNANSAGIFVDGLFSSMAGAKDGSVYLLDNDNNLVVISPDNHKKSIKLPTIMESKPGDRFCDMVVEDDRAWFCGFPFPVVFELSLEKPDSFKIIRPSDQEIAMLHLVNVSKGIDGLIIKDADEFVFRLENSKPLKKLPNYSTLDCSSNGTFLIIPPPQVKLNLGISRGDTVLDGNGKLFWKAPAPKLPKRVQSVEFLGSDKLKRDIFLVMTGSGELDTEFCLYAVSSGKIISSKKIKGPDGLEMQHFCRLSPDGTILVVESATDGKAGIILKRIVL